jgi:hypothetical protein
MVRPGMSAIGGIVLQKSFCGMGLKFSEAWARRLNNDVRDHVATRQTHRRFRQRVCGSIERRLSLVSFFGENLAAAAFGTFATLSPLIADIAQRGRHVRFVPLPDFGRRDNSPVSAGLTRPNRSRKRAVFLAERTTRATMARTDKIVRGEVRGEGATIEGKRRSERSEWV